MGLLIFADALGENVWRFIHCDFVSGNLECSGVHFSNFQPVS